PLLGLAQPVPPFAELVGVLDLPAHRSYIPCVEYVKGGSATRVTEPSASCGMTSSILSVSVSPSGTGTKLLRHPAAPLEVTHRYSGDSPTRSRYHFPLIRPAAWSRDNGTRPRYPQLLPQGAPRLAQALLHASRCSPRLRLELNRQGEQRSPPPGPRRGDATADD